MQDHTPFEPFITLPRLRGARTPSGQSAALLAVLQERKRQIDQFGHTPEADDARDLHALAKTAGRFLHRMNETASLHRVEATRGDAVRLAAYALAVAESCDRRIHQPPLSATLPL